MKYKTYNAWLAAGYHVIKGQKSHRHSFGKPVFSEEQVEANWQDADGDYDSVYGPEGFADFEYDQTYGW
jgi:hypothetical protein